MMLPLILLLVASFNLCLGFNTNESDTFEIECADFGIFEHGIARIDIIPPGNKQITVKCDGGYELEGPAQVICDNGEWIPSGNAKCAALCEIPSGIPYGNVEIHGSKTKDGLYRKGAIATYTCQEGYSIDPVSSEFRVCLEGAWSGSRGTCVQITGCRRPRSIANGYFVPEKFQFSVEYDIGQRLHYSCNPGYVLDGTPVQQCLDDGTWSPKIPPVCERKDSTQCSWPSVVTNAKMEILQGYKIFENAREGTVLQVKCNSGYRNERSPCEDAVNLTCVEGEWKGGIPSCVEEYLLRPVLDCIPRRGRGGYFSSNETNAIMTSAATGAGVLGLLLIICLAIVCRRKKPLSRAVVLPPPRPRLDLGDHAVLVRQNDRLGLIAFAEGLQGCQSTLPTYEEATRERTGPGFASGRIQRPHWPSLGMRRARNSPNPDMGNRQGSFASHTPSMRSGGDSMGSTDTVAVSEGSTTVTLDTASSHSGSQPGSCRVHYGSLASFDTSSVMNADDLGVPLLEENELEEVQGDCSSMAIENRSIESVITDAVIFKLSSPTEDLG